jgi:hypothetical protein
MFQMLRKAPSAAEIRTKIAVLEAELPKLQQQITDTFDDDEGPAFSTAIADRLAVQERLKLYREQLTVAEARERQAAEEARAAAAADERRLEQKRFEKLAEQFTREANLFARNARALAANIRDLGRMAKELGITWGEHDPKSRAEQLLNAQPWDSKPVDFEVVAAARLDAARKRRFDPEPLPELRKPKEVPQFLPWHMNDTVSPSRHGPVHSEQLGAQAVLRAAEQPSAADVKSPVENHSTPVAPAAVEELPPLGLDDPAYLEELELNRGELARHGISIDAA